MKIGVGVEGPSDFQFWSKVLPKHFRGFQFDIRNLKNRDKLIRATPDLLDEFRSLSRHAAFILVDGDSDPCVTSTLDCFDAATRAEAAKPLPVRFLHLCVAVKRMECWLLADAHAIQGAISGAVWSAPSDTSSCHGKNEIKRLLQSRTKAAVGYNEIEFAKTIAPKFVPGRAQNHSGSFDYFWTRMTTACSTP